MKTFFGFILLGSVIGLAAVALATEAPLTQAEVRQPRKLAPILDTRTVVQTDAAATNTTTTAYTPARVGQLLTGKVSTTGAVWVATGLTSNDWTKVSN